MKNKVVKAQVIENKIFWIRRQKVMLDTHLAELYQVEVRALVQAVKRNLERFPDDFMFQLSNEENDVLRSQIVISNRERQLPLKSQTVISKNGRGGRRSLPYAFTEQGVAMLSSVLNSRRAIQVNIQIMRIFTRLKEMLAPYRELQKKMDTLEKNTNHKFVFVFTALGKLLDGPRRKFRVKGFTSAT